MKENLRIQNLIPKPAPVLTCRDLFIFLWPLIMACGGISHVYSPEKKYSPEELRNDFDIGWQIYKKNHPGYDWYYPADSVDARFASVRASLTDSMNEPEFRLRLSYALASIRCGHTSVIASKAYRKYARNSREPIFPLSVKVWDTDSMVVIQNMLPDSSAIRRGDIITSINNIPPAVFISQMRQYASTDGFSDGFKDIQISSSFPARFKWMYGLSKDYKISYLDSAGMEHTDTLTNYFPAKRDTVSHRQADTVGNMTSRPPFPQKRPSYGSFRYDSVRPLAVLELNNFSHRKVPHLIRSSFKQLRKTGTANLVLDLRTNGGGKIDYSTLLTRFIIDRPFRVADSVWAKDLKLAHPGYIQASWIYRYFRWLFASRQSDGLWHMRQTERREYQPKKRNHFNGNVYVLSGGATFSASSLFLSKVYKQENVIVVGEETGGGARGNNAVMTPRITLPNTGVQLRLPLFRIISNAGLPDIGRGIMPEVPVMPDSRSIRQGRDKKMEKVYELILK